MSAEQTMRVEAEGFAVELRRSDAATSWSWAVCRVDGPTVLSGTASADTRWSEVVSRAVLLATHSRAVAARAAWRVPLTQWLSMLA